MNVASYIFFLRLIGFNPIIITNIAIIMSHQRNIIITSWHILISFSPSPSFQGISVSMSFCISDFGRLDFKTEDYIPSSSVSDSDIRNSPSLLRGIRLYHQGVSLYTYIHHCHCMSSSLSFWTLALPIAILSFVKSKDTKERKQLVKMWKSKKM